MTTTKTVTKNTTTSTTTQISEVDGLKFTITPFIRSVISNDSKLKEKYSKYLNSQQPFIPFSTLKDIAKTSTKKVYFQDLIKDATIYYPPKAEVIPDPEFIARKQHLEKLHKEYEYSKLVKNVYKKETDLNELSSFRSQISIAVNILVTFFTLLVGGIFVGHKWLNSQLYGLICGLVLGIIGVAVEIWLFVLRSSQHQMEKDKAEQIEEKVTEWKIKKRTRQIKKEQAQPLLTDGSSSSAIKIQ
ncbi:hypothetical protein RB653_009483 [Dictyostelium firmibasis]|uniref:Uncharacterized protein n=1 Tax=Dictyostelium firmibasis TaxID=79012 RepID=A0AAN7YTT7_9MYCE